MSQKAKPANGQPALLIDSDVVRKIRQHARSSIKTEICGVLIGQDRPGRIEVQASIAGENADQAGAHVTFTQDTWEHIYQIKDRDYPDERIVGWYHSHPGFGIFLSEHDAFIHKNFFASPGQVAWVFDPHSDEEGCFGWVSGRLERLSQVSVLDSRGGERVPENARPEPSPQEMGSANFVEDRATPQEFVALRAAPEQPENEDSGDSLMRLTTTIFSHLTVLLLGIIIAWYLFPRVQLVPVPVDPLTGRPLPGYSLEAVPRDSSKDPGKEKNSSPAPPPSTGGSKDNNAGK